MSDEREPFQVDQKFLSMSLETAAQELFREKILLQGLCNQFREHIEQQAETISRLQERLDKLEVPATTVEANGKEDSFGRLSQRSI